jgi:mRNA interferase MazF
MPVRHPHRRGDVLLVQFPFSGGTGSKARPAVVLSTDLYHEEWDELLVVSITSRPPRTLRPTDHALQDWRPAGLSQPSWVRSHLATVDRRLVLRQVGQASPRDLVAIEQCLRLATGL